MGAPKLARSWIVAVAMTFAAPSPARAEDEAGVSRAGRPMVIAGGRGFVVVPPPGGFVPPGPGVAATPSSRILYINDCKPDGCMIDGADRDDSRLNQSSIVQGHRRLSPYNGTQANWDAMVACVRENYAPYEIRVVTEDPGNVPHYEAFAAGVPNELGFIDILGVASRWCTTFPNAVSFSFLNYFHRDGDDMCWTVSQESAHNFGLSHSMLSTDAMTYISNPPRKRFVNDTACIGTQGCCRPDFECMCGLVEQNSHLRLLQTFGPAGAVPPDIFIDEPGNGARVRPGFAVRSTVTDWDGVTLVELLIDDAVVGSLTAPPFDFDSPATLAGGEHRVTVRATDAGARTGQVNITVRVDPPCTGDESCAAEGDGLVCRDGDCVPAPPDEGGGCQAGRGAAPVTMAAFGAGLFAAALSRRRRR